MCVVYNFMGRVRAPSGSCVSLFSLILPDTSWLTQCFGSPIFATANADAHRLITVRLSYLCKELPGDFLLHDLPVNPPGWTGSKCKHTRVYIQYVPIRLEPRWEEAPSQ